MSTNSKSIGETHEALILARLLQLGWVVSLPFGDNQRYDMVVDRDGVLFRAQCKTGRLSRGAIMFPTASKNGFTGVRSSYEGQIDVFVVYCVETERVYWVPISDAGTSTYCSLRSDPAKNGQKKGIRMADQFIV